MGYFCITTRSPTNLLILSYIVTLTVTTRICKLLQKVGNETNNISADDRMKSTTEYLTVDENHLFFKASEEIIDFSELHLLVLNEYK